MANTTGNIWRGILGNDQRMSKILIFGSNGLLGSQLMERLPGELVGLTKEDADVTDAEAVKRVINEHQPTVVINATAYNNVDGAEEQEGWEAAQALNGTAPGVMASVAKEIGASFVHFSTEMVFSGEKKQVNEDEEPSPYNKYGKSKALGEQSVLDAGGNFYIIRTSRLYGPVPEGHQGKEPFIQLMNRLAIDKDELSGVADEASCCTYTVDLAEYTAQLLEDQSEPGIYHGVNEGSASWYDFAKESFAIKGININFSPVPATAFPRPAKRAKEVELINNKGPQMRPWKDALRAFLTESPQG